MLPSPWHKPCALVWWPGARSATLDQIEEIFLIFQNGGIYIYIIHKCYVPIICVWKIYWYLSIMTKKYQLYIINYLNVYNYVNICIYIVFSPLCYVYFIISILPSCLPTSKALEQRLAKLWPQQQSKPAEGYLVSLLPRVFPCRAGFLNNNSNFAKGSFEPNWQCKVANLRQNPSLIVSCWFIACHLSPTTIVVGFLWACRTLQINRRRRRCLVINGHDW